MILYIPQNGGRKKEFFLLDFALNCFSKFGFFQLIIIPFLDSNLNYHLPPSLRFFN
jgi:hypothetical protein